MRRIIASAIALLLALGFAAIVQPGVAHAQYAGDDNDLALTMDMTPTSSAITNGTNVDISFTITNVGINSFSPDNPQVIYLPKQLTYVSVTDDFGYDDLNCQGAPIKDHYAYDIDVKWDDHTYVNCQGDLYYQQLEQLAPGESLHFTLHTVANAALPDNTLIYGYHQPHAPEFEWADIINYYDNAVSTGGDPSALNTNNMFVYTYDAPVTQGTSANNNSNNSQSQTTVAGRTASGTQTQSSDGTSTDSTGTLNGDSLTTESESKSDTSKKAEVALDLRNALPDRISREDNGRWEALLSGEYKNQIIAGLSILILCGTAFFITRKRYLKKISDEKEYRKALKVKSLKLNDGEIDLNVDQESLVN